MVNTASVLRWADDMRGNRISAVQRRQLTDSGQGRTSTLVFVIWFSKFRSPEPPTGPSHLNCSLYPSCSCLWDAVCSTIELSSPDFQISDLRHHTKTSNKGQALRRYRQLMFTLSAQIGRSRSGAAQREDLTNSYEPQASDRPPSAPSSCYAWLRRHICTTFT